MKFMRLATYISLFSSVLLCQQAVGQGYSITPSKAEKEKIKAGVQAMHDALLEGDMNQILDKTYPPLIIFSGGRTIFEQTVQHAIDQLKKDGMVFESYQLGDPTDMFLSGTEFICFVPEVSVARIQGRRFRTTGFVIAVKGGATTKWKYLQGIHLKKDPDALWRLFPDLSREIKLPPIKQEALAAKPAIPK